jgi:hypothetical protein
MLDRNLLPRNQLQSVERNIYSKLDTSRTAPSNENTLHLPRILDDISRNSLSGTGGAVLILASAVVLGKSSNENTSADFSRNTNDNFDISEHTFVDSNVIELSDIAAGIGGFVINGEISQ